MAVSELLSVAQIRREYGIGRTMIYETLNAGTLKGKVIGKRGTRVRRDEVERWLAALPDYQAKNRVRQT